MCFTLELYRKKSKEKDREKKWYTVKVFTFLSRICLSLDVVESTHRVDTIHLLKSFATIHLRQSNFVNELFLMASKLNLNLINLLLQHCS